MEAVAIYRPTVTAVREAAKLLEGVALKTPLHKSQRHSRLFESEIYLKREDLQSVRSYKIRGAYNKMASLSLSLIHI